MKLSPNLNEALNQQILMEMHNQLVYMQISSYFEDLQLKNIAKYFKDQAKHEGDHAYKFMDYINDRTGGKVSLGTISMENLSFSALGEVAKKYILAEEETTQSIEEIYDLAFSEKSYMDLGFIEEMLNEQVEEEDSAQHFSKNLLEVKDIVLFDKELG